MGNMYPDKKSGMEIEGKVKVSSKGQIVIPAVVREAAGIYKAGQELRYRYKDGKVTFELEEHLSPKDLLGFFDTEDDNGDFVLELDRARDERSDDIIKRKP